MAEKKTERLKSAVEPSLRRRLLELAVKEDRTESALVRRAVLELLDRADAAERKAAA